MLGPVLFQREGTSDEFATRAAVVAREADTGLAPRFQIDINRSAVIGVLAAKVRK
jgi:hypothetical protein